MNISLFRGYIFDRNASYIKEKPLKFKDSETGADRETRTPDPLITNQLLYQLSYVGLKSCRFYI